MKHAAKIITGNTATLRIVYSYRGHLIVGRYRGSASNRTYAVDAEIGSIPSLAKAKEVVDRQLAKEDEAIRNPGK